MYGLGHSSETVALSEADSEAVRALHPAHLRTDLRLYATGWESIYIAAREETRLLGLPLELALFFGSEPEREWDTLQDLWTRCPTPVYSALLLHRDFKVTPPGLLDILLPRLRRVQPGLLVGGGTGAYFTELNRDRITVSDLDFLCFSANPQVHAEDDRTLLENPPALSDVVRSARAFARGRAIHVSPLTLKRRSNPDASGDTIAASPNELAWGVDPRQQSLVGAGWALSSMKYLAEAGVDSVTFCEVTGQRGVIRGQGVVYPLYFVLREVWGSGHARIIPSASDDPLRVDGLMLHDGIHQKMLLSNLTRETQKVRAAWSRSPARLRVLDESTVAAAMSDPCFFDGGESVTRSNEGWVTLSLPPFALALLESAEQ